MTNNKKTVKVKRKYRKNKSGLFSNFDSVMITVMLVSVLVVSLWGIYNSVNHEPNPEVNPTQTEAPSTLGSSCPTVFPEEVEKAAKFSANVLKVTLKAKKIQTITIKLK